MLATTEPVILTKKSKILVVDDRPEGLLALEAVLPSQDYHLVKAASGYEALSYVAEQNFAVILLDVQMPELDGFETARLIRQNHRSQKTPIIFVTAINKEVFHLYRGYEAGAVDYIFKPFDPLILRSKVNVFIELFEKNQQIQQQANLLRKMELQEKERQMTQIKQEGLRRYANLADAVPHIIIKLQPNGTIEYFNQQWSEYAGSESEINWDEVIHPHDKRKFLTFWLRIRRRYVRDAQIELRIHGHKHGDFRWHLVRVVAEVKNNEVIGWICTCTDIHDIKKTEEALRNLSQELNKSNKELEEFAYVASHDLKEPLHVVSSFAYLLEKRLQPKLENAEKDYLKFIQQGTQQAQTLIKDLLEYSRTGKEKLFVPIDITDILDEVCSNLKMTIEEAGAVISYDSMPVINANHLEMLQLFQNLITNGIKYRSDQPLKIHISVKEESDVFIFSVKDNGIGIDPQFKERIFGMFQRLHAKSEYSGTGIGLAICKKIVDNHDGKIWVDSQLGQGATFYFTIKK